MIKKIIVLLAGMLVTVAVYAAGAQLRADHPDSYTVRRGDTLWDISAERLGNPYRWPRLFGENRGQILDPDVIEIDDRIRIPGACRPPGGE